jgi:quinol monooxygenase YgiN
MIIVTTAITIDPARTAEVPDLVRSVWEGTVAEPGCEAYSFAVDVMTPGKVTILGMWTDQEAFAAHLEAPHTSQFASSLSSISLGVQSRRFEGNEVVQTR